MTLLRLIIQTLDHAAEQGVNLQQLHAHLLERRVHFGRTGPRGGRRVGLAICPFKGALALKFTILDRARPEFTSLIRSSVLRRALLLRLAALADLGCHRRCARWFRVRTHIR